MLVPASYRLSVYRRLLDIGQRLFGTTRIGTRVFRLPFNLCAKYGDNVLQSEADVLRFVEKHTTVPVPRVMDCISIPSGAFIVMTRLPGDPLRARLSVGMTEDERAQFTKDIGSSLRQLHSDKKEKRKFTHFFLSKAQPT